MAFVCPENQNILSKTKNQNFNLNKNKIPIKFISIDSGKIQHLKREKRILIRSPDACVCANRKKLSTEIAFHKLRICIQNRNACVLHVVANRGPV